MARKRNKPTLRNILDERTYRKARRRSRRRANLAHKRNGRDLEQDVQSMEARAAEASDAALELYGDGLLYAAALAVKASDRLRQRAVRLSGRVS